MSVVKAGFNIRPEIKEQLNKIASSLGVTNSRIIELLILETSRSKVLDLMINDIDDDEEQ